MLEVIKIFANWGFPAALCIYLLWRETKVLRKLEVTIGNHLVHAIEDLKEVIEKLSIRIK